MDTWIVVCRADRNPDGTPGRYELATRRVFALESEAQAYAAGISTSREPTVIPGDWAHLRLPRTRDAFGRALLAFKVPVAIVKTSDFSMDDPPAVWRDTLEVQATGPTAAQSIAASAVRQRPEFNQEEHALLIGEPKASA